MSASTLLRINTPTAAAYVAVPTGQAVEILAGLTQMFGDFAASGDLDADTMPWDVLPPAARWIADEQVRPGMVLVLGTTSAGQWATWRLPMPAPPVPG